MTRPEMDGPIAFEEPWQAEAFSLAVALQEAGVFSGDQWTQALGEALRGGDGGQDGEEAYYRAWVWALERLLDDKGLVSIESLQARQNAWDQAYRRTPHGLPVELDALSS